MKYDQCKNLKVIKKFYNNKINDKNYEHSKCLKLEFKEWVNDSFSGKEIVWTLPDLTRTERFENFYRALKKRFSK